MAPAPQPARAYPADIRILTSLRWFAAAWVVLFHWSNYFPQSGLKSLAVVKYGFLGVDFFFILSGFVLAHVYMARQEQGRLDYWNFLSRRIARIYPMHVLMLVVMIIFGIVSTKANWVFTAWDPGRFVHLPRGELLRETIGNFLLIHAWGAGDALQFNMPSWSISAEWFAYLLFPLVTAVLAPAVRRPALVLAALAIGIVLYFYAVRAAIGLAVFSMTWNVGILRILPEFVLGVALYRFGMRHSAGRSATLGFFAAVAAMLASVLLRLPLPVIVLTFGALILAAADAERNGGLKAACTPFPVLLGEVSYAVYMIHFGFGIALYDLVLPDWQGAGPGTALLLIAAGIVAVTLLAWAAHIWFERPVRDWINANASRIMRPRPQSEPAV